MRPFGDAVRGVVFATILWFVLCACVDAAGFRFIRELRWQVPGYCLFITVLTVDSILAGSRRRRRQLQFSTDIESTAADLGLAYVPTIEHPSVALSCFEKWHSGTEGIIGAVDGVSVTMFDMTYGVDDAECEGFRTRTIILLPADGLPALTATPRFMKRFAHILGQGGMTFDSAYSPAIEVDVVRQFSRSFRIELPGNPGPFTLATPSLQALEESVRRIMTPELMATLLQHRGWSFQAGAGWLACWHGQARCPPSKRPQFIRTASAIRSALIAAAVEPSRAVLPALQLPSSGQLAARAVVMILGMFLGLYSAFFFGIFRMIPRQLPGLQIILLLIPFPMAAVGGVVGGVLGYWIGVVLGNLPAIARWTPPPQATSEQKEEKARRDSWRRVCGCLGFFAGFSLGILAFAALDQLSWPIMIVILPFGGAIAGSICGIKICGWISRSRAKNVSRICDDNDALPHDERAVLSDSSGKA